MIIPSIDLQGGHAVQLVGGKDFELSAGEPYPLMERFRLAGEVAIVDLDAAMSKGDNAQVIERLARMGRVRVGGGIRSVEQAKRWLDLGVDRIVLGTAATPELLKQLPKERLIAALDAVDGEVVVEGWRTKTGKSIEEQMLLLRDYVGGFLVTFVEREGRLGGTAMERVAPLIEAAGDAELTIAGGVTTCAEIAQLHHMGVHAQVGMALYKGLMDLGEAIAAPLKTDRADGLWPTVIVDERGVALGLAYSNMESIKHAVDTRTGTYWSRSRDSLWIKGASSGATQELLAIDLDCDADALRFTVRQQDPGFCHLERWSCWGHDRGLGRLERTLTARLKDAPEGSYTRRLFEDDVLLKQKLMEEARELTEAATAQEITWEAADVLYFALVTAIKAGVSLPQIEAELDRRALKITRRRGDAKPATTAAESEKP